MSRIVVVGDVMLDVVAHLSGPVAVGSDSEASVSLFANFSWVVNSASHVSR